MMTNDEEVLTFASMSRSILEDMLTPIIHDIISSSILNEQVIRRDYGTLQESKIIDSTNPLYNNSQNDTGVNIPENFQLKRVKNGYSNNSSSPNSNANSNTNSNKGTPPPSILGLQAQPDFGRLQFVKNGRDIYYGKSLSNTSGNGNSSGDSNGSANGSGTSNGESKGNISMNNSTSVNGSNNGGSRNNNDSEIEYFKCLNCDRKIAGSRFAAHIDRCLGGRTRK